MNGNGNGNGHGNGNGNGNGNGAKGNGNVNGANGIRNGNGVNGVNGGDGPVLGLRVALCVEGVDDDGIIQAAHAVSRVSSFFFLLLCVGWHERIFKVHK